MPSPPESDSDTQPFRLGGLYSTKWRQCTFFVPSNAKGFVIAIKVTQAMKSFVIQYGLLSPVSNPKIQAMHRFHDCKVWVLEK